MKQFVKFAVKFFVAIAVALLLAFPAMLLWNDLMPFIFKLPTLTFWQTLGLMVLVQLFFNRNQSAKE